jgi:hypothetical protein
MRKNLMIHTGGNPSEFTEGATEKFFWTKLSKSDTVSPYRCGLSRCRLSPKQGDFPHGRSFKDETGPEGDQD